MDTNLQGVQGVSCYKDDIIPIGKTPAEPQQHLDNKMKKSATCMLWSSCEIFKVPNAAMKCLLISLVIVLMQKASTHFNWDKVKAFVHVPAPQVCMNYILSWDWLIKINVGTSSLKLQPFCLQWMFYSTRVLTAWNWSGEYQLSFKN